VGGSGKKDTQSSVGSTAKSVLHQAHHAFAAPTAKAAAKVSRKTENQPVAVHTAKEVSPDQVIPMDDDFKDF
ncbi:MAG: hypothetical protein GY850_35750, partial [bacterium]|nr:hypothetical protein [bacterium]